MMSGQHCTLAPTFFNCNPEINCVLREENGTLIGMSVFEKRKNSLFSRCLLKKILISIIFNIYEKARMQPKFVPYSG